MAKKYTSTMRSEITCPYCNKILDIQMGKLDIINCSQCSKNFYCTKYVEHTVAYDCKQDCELNGADHKWTQWRNQPYEYCEHCNKLKRIED